MKISISLAQMSYQYGDVEANVRRATDWIAKAAEQGSDMILLPELWASGYDLENWSRYASSISEGVFADLADLAHKYRIVIGGSLLESRNGKAYNTFVLHGKDGRTLGVYRKIHRFRLLEEEKWLGAGDELVLAETPWGQVGMATCYDLRFPEMFQPYAAAGARLTLIVAEWPERRVAHWTKLLQARAIENQMFFAGVNKVGVSQGVQLGGCSAIVDPWGVPMAEGGKDESLVTVLIDLTEADKARRHIPVFRDRRPDVYGGIGRTVLRPQANKADD